MALLQFVKVPIFANRACMMGFMATSWVFNFNICTLQTEVAFCLATWFFSQKTVRTIVKGDLESSSFFLANTLLKVRIGRFID